MQRLLAGSALAVALAGPAWGQTSGSTDRFIVTTDNLTEFAIVDGAVQLQDLPWAFSDPGSDTHTPEGVFNLNFAPQAGYALVGEAVTFTVDMTIDIYDRPTDFLLKPSGSFSVGIAGVPPVTRTSDGGTPHFRGEAFLNAPTFDARASALTTEGWACPSGSGPDDCDFGTDLVPLDASVRFLSFTVTPLLTAVPEPRMAWLWLMGLAACLARATPPGAR
jgi:hypothetical protein